MLKTKDGKSPVREAPSMVNISSLVRFPISRGTPPDSYISQNQFHFFKQIVSHNNWTPYIMKERRDVYTSKTIIVPQRQPCKKAQSSNFTWNVTTEIGVG